MNQTAPTTEVEETKKTEIVEANPLALIAQMERDTAVLQAALRKIHNMKLSSLAGGPSNQNFGRRYQQAFEKCQEVAHEAIHRTENYTDA